MLKFTFDTNCLIDVELSRDGSPSILAILAAHREQRCDAAFVAVSASEKQEGDYYLNSYRDFEDRLAKLNFGDIPHIWGMAYFDISYFDYSLFAGGDMVERERQFHEALFANIDFKSTEYIERLSPTSDDELDKYRKKWRNAWCDRQMIWAHEHHKRDVFVTSDMNFGKRLSGKLGFEHLKISSPEEAAAML
ncbi:hypothetical protein [uncultured Ruegeria sp.]|uniref:hypothetical protein n=1 Tax=uncultured Ruegeria sp. TaxID=259304 RepID=UPI002610E934|nr:hypothetical protein [uncultured Ruegeria sp.]